MRTGRWLPAAAALASALALAAVPVPGEARAALGRCGDPAQRPWCDTALTPDRRTALLMPELTGDEKIALLASDDPFGGPLGGFFETAHADTADGIERLGIPPVYMADGPAGVRQGKATALPAPIALAAGFDREAAGLYGGTVAWEARHRGNDLVFGPTVDVLRTPRNGRTFEGFGEDPYLSATLGVPWIKAAQDRGVMTSVKHMAVYTQETDRLSLSMKVDPRTLREIYLPPFEAAVKDGGAATVMCGFGRLNGRWACQDGAVLNGILRSEWGFEGFVPSDHTAAQDTADAANGGLDMELPIGMKYNAFLLKMAVAQKKVTQAAIDGHVRNILRTMFRFGLFDRQAYPNDLTRIDRTESQTAARRIAEGGITLLKNDGVLPLKAPRSIALIGRAARESPSGFGSAKVVPFTAVSAQDGITRRAGAGATVTYTSGDDRAAAAAAARGADVALVFATDSQGEFFDKSCLTLECGEPLRGDQDGLISEVAEANPNTIVVLNTGGPVLTPWAGQVRGVIEAWYPGQEAGNALARVLYGDVDPGGRLPVTFPVEENDAPAAANPAQYPGVDKTTTFSEGVLVGYRHYDAKGIAPRYPFGHGLSYTTFAYSGLTASTKAVQVTVTNTGQRTGVAVPQLYIGMPSPGVDVPQPPKQLKGYAKVTLAPGESTKVTFPLSPRSFAYWNEGAKAWKVAGGCYKIMVGSSSRRIERTGMLGACG
ncbi:beta-glucosidase family protein [Actinomadura madurae]|uniref:beta-glucosidase family protein n=1 Tax=Actinomadura madurae TaxID=1993 RepID=UPI0020D23A64|nr:glycoside hydrolase family 3 C-terminal domain-containing protein [Actinomadura madurae]MCP9954863.1 glycoside hydrolase family 3 C-terminal domain-containing protein [Actinomadura madurae]MCP9971608.1 glycoside hydrolase family 3 C-terminal domain-containing protein [Actinomadura madurae]MCP9984099.1 glycoside hydrolase family 3 C-terminal domain-containing protein [Actinomadura madurae]MCQ0004338.1 glycoside hydrolase family 3 C-terminal domain-containing protein [Actinomadura madurae]MCQ